MDKDKVKIIMLNEVVPEDIDNDFYSANIPSKYLHSIVGLLTKNSILQNKYNVITLPYHVRKKRGIK